MIASYAVMAHMKRIHMLNELLEGLPESTQVVYDQGNNRWDTGARAWATHDKSAQWHVVVQDDAIVCENFEERAESFLASANHNGPVSFYLGAGRPRQRSVIRQLHHATDRVKMPYLLWGVCFALPVHLIDQMLDECDKGIPNYDTRISRFFERRRIGTLYSWPSLVDHRDEESLTYSNLNIRRVAHWFADDPKPRVYS